MHWRNFIIDKGYRTIASELNCSYEIARLWGNGGQIPGKKNIASLTKLAKDELPDSEFAEFKSTLASDMQIL